MVRVLRARVMMYVRCILEDELTSIGGELERYWCNSSVEWLEVTLGEWVSVLCWGTRDELKDQRCKGKTGFLYGNCLSGEFLGIAQGSVSISICQDGCHPWRRQHDWLLTVGWLLLDSSGLNSNGCGPFGRSAFLSNSLT